MKMYKTKQHSISVLLFVCICVYVVLVHASTNIWLCLSASFRVCPRYVSSYMYRDSRGIDTHVQYMRICMCEYICIYTYTYI